MARLTLYSADEALAYIELDQATVIGLCRDLLQTAAERVGRPHPITGDADE